MPSGTVSIELTKEGNFVISTTKQVKGCWLQTGYHETTNLPLPIILSEREAMIHIVISS